MAAEAFATNPAHWLSELESGTDSEGDFSRRFLIRACYLNPSRFSQFRPNFTRAGFQVVDCPSLTQQGKSSADINLVLDAVDALAAPTHYEEFVIVSADADFTPLALRCRAADRRVTIMTASPAASAYRAVADSVITADELADLVTHTASTLPVENAGRRARRPSSSRPATTPPARAKKAAPEPVVAATARQLRRAQGRAPARAHGRPPGAARHRRAAARRRPSPPCRRRSWAGAGGFLPWLRARSSPRSASRRVRRATCGTRSGSARPTCRAPSRTRPPSALQNQVVAVTDTPGLSQSTYRVLLTALAADLAAHPFDRAETSRRVRDACQKAGAEIGRSTVNFVISRHHLTPGCASRRRSPPRDLATAWADNVVGLCRGARMEMSTGDVAAIRAWVGGGLLAGLTQRS